MGKTYKFDKWSHGSEKTKKNLITKYVEREQKRAKKLETEDSLNDFDEDQVKY